MMGIYASPCVSFIHRSLVSTISAQHKHNLISELVSKTVSNSLSGYTFVGFIKHTVKDVLPYRSLMLNYKFAASSIGDMTYLLLISFSFFILFSTSLFNISLVRHKEAVEI